MRHQVRTLCGVSCSLLLSAIAIAGAAQSKPGTDGATLASLRREIDELKREVFELRQLVVQGAALPSPGLISTRDRPTLGNHRAPIVIVEFVDFQCPFCALHAKTTFAELRSRYIDREVVRYIVKNLPLDDTHPQAFRAAIAGECALGQRRYWEMRSALFELRQGSVLNLALAGNAGLDEKVYQLCSVDPAAAIRVRSDVAEARALGIQGTPSFALGKRSDDGDTVRPEVILSGAQPIEKFAAAIDRIRYGEREPRPRP